MKMGMQAARASTLPLRDGRSLRDLTRATTEAVSKQIPLWGARSWRVVAPHRRSPKNPSDFSTLPQGEGLSARPSLKQRADSGYTLVELLVVVAILGLLTLIAT